MCAYSLTAPPYLFHFFAQYFVRQMHIDYREGKQARNEYALSRKHNEEVTQAGRTIHPSMKIKYFLC